MLKNILEKFVLLLFTLALCSCATEERVESPSGHAPEKLQSSSSIFSFMDNYNTVAPIHFPDNTDYWNYIKSKQFGYTETYLFLPKGEAIDNWTEKLTIDHYLAEKSMSPSKYLQDIAWPAVVDQCYSTPNLRVLKRTDQDVVYTYSMHQCGKNVNQIMVARIIRANDGGINAINYATRTTSLNDMSMQYIVDFLNKVTTN